MVKCMSVYKDYEKEVKNKYGQTNAYKEYINKTRDNSKEKWIELTKKMNDIISKFADCMNDKLSHDSNLTQSLVETLQKHISDNYYNCTKEILYGLGQMYVLDERFKNNIDKHGSGTAEFISKAVEFYAKKNN